MRALVVMILVLGVLAMVSCGNRHRAADAPPEIPPRQDTQAEPDQPAPPPSPGLPSLPEAAHEPGLLVTYTRSGGFAGRHEVLTVHDDGQLELTVRQRGQWRLQADQQQLDQLRQMLQSQEFQELAGPYQIRGADLITYTITVHEPVSRSVVSTDGAEVPPFLRQLRRHLDSLRGAAATRGEQVEEDGGG
jgi:hypothetical protein